MFGNRSTSTPRPRAFRRRFLLVLGILTALVGLAAALLLGPFWRLTSQFDDITYRQPSRLYARPIRLTVGLPWSQDRLIADLRDEGYRESAETSPRPPLPMGRYHASKGVVAVHLRSFPSPDGAAAMAGGTAEILFRGSRIGHLEVDGHDVRSLTLAPPLLASYYGPEWKERRPVAVGEVPQDLVDAVLAAEDASFFSHSGLSLTGIVRAAWVDVRGGSHLQGGSTLTQQLVKNLYLTQERTLTRKVQEVVLTLILELRFQKKQILEAYLNEIYLGSSSGVNLMGVGAAARAYFGKDASQLDLGESALLGGMISAPGLASPIDHPDRARERRDWVLGRMEKLRMADHERVARAMALPIAVAPEPLVRRRVPFFADAAAQEAERRFGVTDLEDGGYTLFSTLDWRDQQAAQKALESGLQALDRGLQKGHPGAPLQAAVVSVDPVDGDLLAYVGGRGYGKSQFDRAGQAHRQMGSAFKPVVYAAAFESRIAMPSSFIEDAPLTVKAGNRVWSPKNDDGDYHGWVSVRTALEHSYNAASARLALQAGLPKIVELARRLGLPEVAEPYPAVSLGVDAVTPVELATVYATFAAGGVRPPVHGLLAIRDRHGKMVAGTALPQRERVLTPQTSFLVTSVLQGVLDRGTARGARAQGVEGELAGKTGTTNDQRDSWFAGYSPDRATVVWVGYDDNSPTRLSGARAAVPIWSRFTTAVRPPGSYPTFPQPSGIATAVIDPTTGLLATEYCPTVLTEVFPEGQVPSELCNRHEGWAPEQLALAQGMAGREREGGEVGRFEERGAERPRALPPVEGRGEKRHPFRRWLRRFFGGAEEPKPPPARGDGGEGGDQDHGDGPGGTSR